jgi:hypothetical protein
MSKHLQRCTWIVAAVLALLYAARVAPHWKIGRDSSLYVGLAQSVANGDGFRFLNQTFERVPFGLPAMLSLFWQESGPDWLLMNAVMAALALVTLWLVYRSVGEIAGPWWGLIVAFLTGWSHCMMRFSGQLMTDLPAMFGFWAGFYYLQQLVLRPEATTANACGAAAGLLLGSTFRFSTPFMAPVFALAPWLRRRADGPGFVRRLLLSVLIALPTAAMLYAWFNYHIELRPGEVSAAFWTPADTASIAQQALARWPKAVLVPDAALEILTTQAAGAHKLLTPGHTWGWRDISRVALVALPLVWLAIGARQVCRKDRCLSALTVLCYTACIAAFSFEATPRYLLPVSPFLFWFAAEGLEAVWRRLRGLSAIRLDVTLFPLSVPVAVLLALLLAANAVKTLREVRLAHAADYYAVYDRGHWKPYVEVARWLAAHTPPDIRLWSTEAGPLAFLCNRLAVGRIEQLRPGDYLAMAPLDEDRPHEGPANPGRVWTDELTRAAWRLAESDAAKEVFRSGNVRVFKLLPGAVTAPDRP